jgi:hypothetical protein
MDLFGTAKLTAGPGRKLIIMSLEKRRRRIRQEYRMSSFQKLSALGGRFRCIRSKDPASHPVLLIIIPFPSFFKLSLDFRDRLQFIFELKNIIMKKYLFAALMAAGLVAGAFAQKKPGVPQVVKTAFAQKYPEAKHVTWEKEKGNYEGNWGGKSGEDHSALFTPAGNFVEIVDAISISQLPAPALAYVKAHYKGAKIAEAGKVTDAKGKTSYEAEVNKKDIVFDERGNFVQVEKE